MAPLASLREGAEIKHRHYANDAERLGADFVAFGMETYGGVNEEGLQWMRSVAAWAVDTGAPYSYQQALSLLHTGIATAMQKGNAAAILEGHTRARYLNLQSDHSPAGNRRVGRRSDGPQARFNA